MTIGYIIAVYKDVEALSLIIDAIDQQTHRPNEIIIAEDGNSPQMAQFIQSIELDGITLHHTTQEDLGWRKDRSLNNAIRASSSEYLIITDGDIVPYPNFVKNHLKLAQEKTVLCGRRVNPGPKISAKLRARKLSVKSFAKYFWWHLISFIRDNMTKIEEGIELDVDGTLFQKLQKGKRNNSSLLGCCWSIWRKDIEMINGFDEDFERPTTGCDTDIERRLRHFGVAFKSCRNAANAIHLYHKEKYDPKDSQTNLKIMHAKEKQFVCSRGLKQID
jgi:GT2 family glycosyltransferase